MVNKEKDFDEVCFCGHTRESHLSRDSWRDGKCVWGECDCNKFALRGKADE